ncbi:MAG: ATP-binding protein [Melioribacteraceae bacterium]
MENQLMLSLSKSKLLKNVDIAGMNIQGIKGRLITIGEGEILFREGDYSDHIFLVVSGEINLLKKRLLGKTKSFIFTENDFFGQEEFFEETSRTSTAVALRDSYLISLMKEEVDELIRQDHQVMLNLREPMSEIEEEMNFKKPTAYEPRTSEKPAMPTWADPIKETPKTNIETKAETKVEDHSGTHLFFQSISDSSRFEEENLVHPLEKVEESPGSFPAIDNMEFGSDIFNEDGILKAEFELPSEPHEEVKPIFEEPKHVTEIPHPGLSAKPDEDLNDALFNMLSGNSLPVEQVPLKYEAPEPPQPKVETPKVEPTKDFDNQFFATMGLELPKEEDYHKPIEPTYHIESMAPTSAKVELPQTPPPFKPVPQDYESEDIFAQADAQIKALTKEEEPAVSKQVPTVESTPIKSYTLPANDDSKMSKDELEMILRAAEMVNSTIKIDELLRNIVDVATELTGADRGTLYLVDKEKNELWSLVLIGNNVKEIRLRIGEGLAGYVAKSGETLNIKDVQNDPRFNKDYDRSSGYVTRNMICFPIKNNTGLIIGVLQLLNSKNGSFSGRDEVFLAALSIHSAIALQNAELVEKLLTAERVHSLGKMANFLIQDIKKPVLVSKRYAEHLLHKQLPQDSIQIVEMLLEQLVQVADLVQTTSSYSEGKTILRTVNVSLNNTLADYASRVETFVVSRSCQVYNEFEKDITIKVDIKEFFQCYMHIIKNACDAMPDGGSIYVSTKKDNKNVKILIRDNGLGIPEGFTEKIFEPFMSYGKKEGTGLGLAITRKIVEAHNGTIEVESTTGNGATFIVTLPIASLF